MTDTIFDEDDKPLDPKGHIFVWRGDMGGNSDYGSFCQSCGTDLDDWDLETPCAMMVRNAAEAIGQG